jgi:hypothetical protein
VLIVDRQQAAQISGVPRKPDKLHERFRKALEEGPLHSVLGRWMAQRREQLEALFREGEPDWAAMAKVFGDAGLWDETMRRPTAESAERTWRMVRERG